MTTRITIVVLVLVGCSRRPDDAAPAKASVAPALSSCDALGQRFCESTPADCEMTKQLSANAELREADCTAAVEQLDAIAKMPADTRGAATQKVLLEVMAKSPKITPEQLAAVEAAAKQKALTTDDASLPTDVTCPGVATRTGGAPPQGDEVWCETADGKRHGPAIKWNARGEPVLHAEYDAGALVEARWSVPPSGEIPQSLFLCPQGQTKREDRQGTLVVLRCITAGGRTTAELGWQNGKTIALLQEDAMGNRFVGYMNQPD